MSPLEFDGYLTGIVVTPQAAPILPSAWIARLSGPNKRIVLQLDNAGWHGPENLIVPDGIRLVFQPAHSPELQSAEHLWPLIDETLANRCYRRLRSLRCSVPSPRNDP